ncbi:MAG: DUF5067 domain-containing protein [Blautia sp.]|nr:DUF5067 domain-containing protein [Blautia sp.]
MKKKARVISGIITATVVLSCVCVSAQESYPEAVWELKEMHGMNNTMMSSMFNMITVNIYSLGDRVVYDNGTERTVTPITLIAEDVNDAPFDIGECDKYMTGSGKDAGFCWISDTMMLLPVEVDDESAAFFDENACMVLEKVQDGLEGVPQEIIEAGKNSSTSETADTTASDESYAPAGSSASDGINTAADSAASDESNTSADSADSQKPDPIVTDPTHFETENGIFEFESIEFAKPDIYINNDGNPDLTVFISFKFTNKRSTPSFYLQNFNPRVYQNGVEINSLTGKAFGIGAAPESYYNKLNKVLQGYSITMSECYELKDTSPITVIVDQNGAGNELSDPMTITFEPDRSMDSESKTTPFTADDSAPFEVSEFAGDAAAPFMVDDTAVDAAVPSEGDDTSGNSAAPSGFDDTASSTIIPASEASYIPEIPDQTPYESLKSQLIDHSWYFNGGDNLTLDALTFRDTACYVEQMKFDGNGKHPGNSLEYFYYFTDTDVVLYSNESEIEKIPYYLEGDIIHLSYGKYLTPEQVHEDLKGYWTLRYSGSEYNILIQDAYIEYESAKQSSFNPDDYFYYGPYSGMYLMNFGGFETEMMHGGDFFYNVINGKGTLLYYSHVCSPGSGMKGQYGYSF